MILTCGEALMDVFIAEGEGLSRPARFAMGGSPFNMAIALARQNVRAGFFGGLSHDAFGAMLRAILAQEHVDGSLAPQLDCPTTLSLVSRDAAGQPCYDFRGEGGADRMMDARFVPAALPDQWRVVALSSYPLVVAPVCEAMLAMARLAAQDRMVTIDVNYRPSLVGDRQQWAMRFAPYERLATIMKASEEDLQLAYDGQLSPDAAAAHFLAQGAGLVLITKGADGAIAYTHQNRVEVAAPPITVVDSVGAGDCFHAGFLAALSDRHALTRAALLSLSAADLRDCLRWAVTAASISVTRQGADPPTRAAIEAALLSID